MTQGWMAAGFVCSLIGSLALGRPAPVFADGPASPVAATTEVREFEVLLRGKPTGSTKFTIEQLPDGRTVVTTDAVVRVSLVVYTYAYEFHGVETWLGDRLVSFRSHGSDGSKKFAVEGTLGPSGCQLVVNQKKSQAPAFLLTCNYWRLPTGELRNRTLPTVDASTGATQNIRVADAPAANIPLGDQTIRATGYRLTGDVDATLWLDAQGRIVRQHSVEQGYATELRLTRISRNTAGAAAPPVHNAEQRPAAGPASNVRK